MQKEKSYNEFMEEVKEESKRELELMMKTDIYKEVRLLINNDISRNKLYNAEYESIEDCLKNFKSMNDYYNMLSEQTEKSYKILLVVYLTYQNEILNHFSLI